MTGKAAERSQIGRDALSMVMRHELKENAQKTSGPSVFAHIGDVALLVDAKSNRSLTTDTLAQVMGKMTGRGVSDWPPLSMVPQAETMVRNDVRLLSDRIAEAIQTPTGFSPDSDMISGLVDKLGDHLRLYTQDGPVRQEFTDLALTSGDSVKSELRDMIREELGPMLTNVLQADDLTQLSDRIFANFQGKMLPVQFTNETTLVNAGQRYDKGGELGSGAFGKVFEFSPQVGNGPSLAVKYMTGGSSGFEAMVKEFTVHSQAYGDGHPNILKPISLTRPNGSEIVMEKASHGDAFKMFEKVDGLVKTGVLTQAQATSVQLTVLRDMAHGMKHMHDNGLKHVDFEPANVFIGDGGVAKIADFGLSSNASKGEYRTFEPVDAPYWQSPEVLINKGLSEGVKSKDVRDTVFEPLKALLMNEELHSDVSVGNVDVDNEMVEKMTDSILQAKREEAFDGKKIDPKAYDCYALGVSMVNAIYGGESILPGEKNRFQFVDADKLLKFHATGEKLIGTHEGAQRPSTGDPKLDDLINSLVTADPKKRATMDMVVHSHTKSLMMSKEDVKREYKESEGDPHVKDHRKQVAMEMVMGDGRKQAKTASALVVNPTHIAIALRYKADETPLPMVTAKGVGVAAVDMRIEAELAGVPIFHNIALARHLFADAELGGYVPDDVYDVIAEILAWVAQHEERLYQGPLGHGDLDMEQGDHKG